MVVETGPDQLHLGHDIDPAGTDTEQPRVMDPADLTTHGVIVGMTGSGKTGLGIVLIEELLASGRSVLALDPKGDLGNLLLSYPDLTGVDLQPWMDPNEARRLGTPGDLLAAETADRWNKGLADSGVPPAKRAAVAAASKTLFTPGSTAGVPLSLLGPLSPPALDWETQAEALRDEIEGLVSGLLVLAGIDADPVASREHILLAMLVEHAWRAGIPLDLAGLLAGVQRPPFRKLGVLDLDTFFPKPDRDKLVLQLNALLASPSFQPWLEGPSLDLDYWLGSGVPRVAVISLAHLSEVERMSVVTMVLTKVVTWMRGLSGTSELRALVYMDEVFGFAPPTAEPPSKKPLMTLMKTARAYGLGMVLSTQNPVDLDYKVMSNAGTWMVGRLQTDRDKGRLLEGIAGIRADADVGWLDATITGLAKRRFLLHSIHEDRPVVFGTRWAMSYLAGPLTLPQIRELTANDRLRGSSAASAAENTARHAGSDSTPPPAGGVRGGALPTAVTSARETPVMPRVADGVQVRFADPAAPWIADINGDPRGTVLEPALMARVHLRFDDASAGVDTAEVYEVVHFPLEVTFDPALGRPVDFDARDLIEEPPPGAIFALPAAPIHTKAFFHGAGTALTEHLARSRTVDVFRSRPVGTFSRIGESRQEFQARVDRLASERADQEAAEERSRLEKRAQSLRSAAADALQRLEEAETGLGAQKREELVSGSGRILGALFGGRLTAKAIVNRASRAASSTARERSQTQRAEARVDTLTEKVSKTDTAVEDFEQEILDRLGEIQARWDAAAREIEEVSIGLERSDVVLEPLVLCWVPTKRTGAP